MNQIQRIILKKQCHTEGIAETNSNELAFLLSHFSLVWKLGEGSVREVGSLSCSSSLSSVGHHYYLEANEN